MPQINVLDAGGQTVALETPNANGRAAAAASRPVALSTEDKASLDAIASQTTLAALLAKIIAAPATEAKQDTANTLLAGLATQTTLAAILAKIIAAPATEAKQDAGIAAIQALVGTEYGTVAASQTNQVLGTTGATGDLLASVLIVPATTSPGAVSIKDGSGGAVTVFAGGANSVATLHPFAVPVNIRSGAGAWQITTGANVSVIASGNFT